MKAVFKYELNEGEIEAIKKFYNSADYCSIEQVLGWTQLLFKSKICYFYMIDGYEIKSFCQISEKFKFAQIIFGPVCCEKELMINSINEIIDYYKKQAFIYLGIQMYYKSGYDTDYIEYILNRDHSITYKFDNENTKSSIEIDLEDSIDVIFSNLRENHKRNIKKALKLQISVDVIKSRDDLISFIDGYLKMCKFREIDSGYITSKNIGDIYDNLIENNRGQILIAKDKDNVIIGGVILVYQGLSVRYLLGTSDPDRRDLPVLHIVLYEAIKRAKNDNFKYFDFWGYNHFADKNDQVFYINHFKKGFGGYYTFFAKKMNIELVPFGYSIYKFLKLIKKILFRLL